MSLAARTPSPDVIAAAESSLSYFHDVAETTADDAVRIELVDAVWGLEDALDWSPELVLERLATVESLVAQLVR